MNISEQSFQRLLEKYPGLSAFGLAGPDFCDSRSVDFSLERQRLEVSYPDFAFCCDWLLDCIPLKRVSFVSPSSDALRSHIEKQTGAAISHGVVIAAVLHLRIPHHPFPDSAAVRVGISLRSPNLGEAFSVQDR